MIKKVLLLSFFLIFASTHVIAKVPDWVRDFDSSQKYPMKLYLVGFGSSVGKNPDASQIAQDNARAEVSRSIVVYISSLLSTIREEKNEQYSQHLSSITQSSTSLQIMGLQTEQYVDDDFKAPMIYAVAYVGREDLQRIYSTEKSDLVAQIRRIIASAQADESNSKFADAAQKYLSLYPLYEDLKEAEAILLVVNESGSIKNAFDELDKETGSSEPPIMSQTEVANKVDQLLSQSLGSINDVARAIVIKLSKQIGDVNKGILVLPFTYQDTKMGSSFARRFHAELENQLGQVAKWKVAIQTESFKPRSSQITRDLAKDSGAEWLLSGTYWEQDNEIKVMANIRDVNSGKILASADAYFKMDILPGNLSLKPENFESAMIQQGAFASGELVSSQLRVDVWTNKGNESPVYAENDEMKVYVRVNREAHVRLLYILADGRWTVLYDDYYIDKTKVNSVVEIPEVFTCAPPFGAEVLVAIARTMEFNPLEDTIEEDGYVFVNKQPGVATRSLANTVRGTKGMKVKRQDAIIIVNQDFQNDLNNGVIPDVLRQELEKERITLSQSVNISTETPGREWLITDANNMQTYLLKLEKGNLSVFNIQQNESKLVITTMQKEE